MRASFSCALVLVAGLVGCSMRAGDLTGIWAVTAESKPILPPASQRATGRLTFRANGEFVAEDIPGELLYALPGDDTTQPVSGTGTWKFHEVDGETVVLLTFRAIQHPRRYQVPNDTHLYIDLFQPKSDLYFFLGDPDNGHRVDFRKLN